MSMIRKLFSVTILLLAMTAMPVFAAEDKKQEDGKYFTKDDVPTYNVKQDGAVDWYTYSGFRRYHSECHVCHGPDGLGSSYAPALSDSMKALPYEDFLYIVAVGRERITASVISKMPGFGENKNVHCYIDDIYVYLKARSDRAIPRGRPKKRDVKPASAKAHEKECFEG
jgi:methanol metabolism-related c-type cytochrome